MTGELRGQWTAEQVMLHLGKRLDELDRRLTGTIEGNDRRYEQRFIDSGTAVEAALNAAKEAVTKAEMAAEKRFEGVNEFRAQLGDQQRTLMPRPEAELRFTNIEERLAAIERHAAERGGARAGVSSGWAWAVAVVGLVGLVIAIATAVLALRQG